MHYRKCGLQSRVCMEYDETAWNMTRPHAVFSLLSPFIYILILKSPILNFRNLPFKFHHTLCLTSNRPPPTPLILQYGSPKHVSYTELSLLYLKLFFRFLYFNNLAH